ncbi:mammalian cell entry protein [Mycobacterium sp. OTB74]|uniref:mammalian cell entry protein n=1 Tax=Mycobacterium sp. OTB74 TaxID=1853452 RepID=UPI002473530F|nr:mammalian cell entry protein [Mycobacterium sp. OTB74]MDH6243808.1 Mce-associated membrane protein [Mycobacterium sp. OTB74]
MTDVPAATDETSELPVGRGVRRRASRPAGPIELTDASPGVAIDVAIPASTKADSVSARPLVQPRRRPHGGLVAAVGIGVVGVLVAVLALGTGLLWHGNRQIEAKQPREQQFVDTAKQTVVNMFTFTQNTLEESVKRFIDGTSGPLRDMMSQGNNADNLKFLWRDTQASSEAVITGAGLESIDDTSGNAKVLISVRVTMTDLNGVNQPSKAYRQRLIVHEDDNGHMTAYDIKWPDGGN